LTSPRDPAAHAGLTLAFREGLASGDLPPGMTARRPDETARRFAVYRNNVVHGLTQAMRRRYPVVERLVGTEFFRALAPLYLTADPPSTAVLIRWGAAFPEFLAGFPPLAGLPYLPDVARLEWLRGIAFHAADAPPLAAGRLAAETDPARLRPGLHPSVGLLRSRHPVVTIWRVNQPGAEPAPVYLDAAETALVLRDRTDGVPVMALSAGDAAFVAALKSGQSLLAATSAAVAAAPGHTPADILGLLFTAGALVAREGED
jgi:hypothetical protein